MQQQYNNKAVFKLLSCTATKTAVNFNLVIYLQIIKMHG